MKKWEARGPHSQGAYTLRGRWQLDVRRECGQMPILSLTVRENELKDTVT